VSAQLATVDRTLSATDARALTDEVKADAAALWAKLLALYEGGAHTALGYASWGAYCAAEFDMGQSAAYRMLDAGRVVAELEAHSPNGGTPASERQARELLPVLRDAGEAAMVEVWHGDRLTAAKVQEAVHDRLRMEQRVTRLSGSENCEWYTPSDVVEAAREVLGQIDVDPASCAFAQRVVRATTYFDAETDGLAQPWRGCLFVNPPYGALGPRFVDKALRAFEAGEVTAAVLVLNGYSFDAGWFRPLWEHLLCFSAGRPHFYNAVGDPGRPAAATVFVYLGPDRPRFADVFGKFGAVVARWGAERPELAAAA
jgi:hypothetical protein